MTLWKRNSKGVGGGGVKTKEPSVGGMDIFWNHTMSLNKEKNLLNTFSSIFSFYFSHFFPKFVLSTRVCRFVKRRKIMKNLSDQDNPALPECM